MTMTSSAWLRLLSALVIPTTFAQCMDDTTTPADLASSPAGDMAGTKPGADLAGGGSDGGSPSMSRRVIIFVWDGLRPDSVTADDTPNLLALKQRGVEFTDNHSTYPTFTMMNAAAFATGGFPGTTGFYGNTLYAPNATGTDAFGGAGDFTDPVFTEDWALLMDLDTYYHGQLLLVDTLFQSAQAAGLKTAAIGKSGPAFLQDYKRGGMIIDERMVWPLDLAKEIQTGGDQLPNPIANAYPGGEITSKDNPTGQGPKTFLVDGVTPDPTAGASAPPSAANAYMMNMYIKYVLPKNPDLTLIWFRSPDSPQHNYGPGSTTYRDALQQQDKLLGALQAALKTQGMNDSTDIVVVSDHGHSSVSGPLALFPKRKIVASATPGKNDVGDVDANGYAVSGDVRMADLMQRAGIANVFDGNGCIKDPIMLGGLLKSDPGVKPNTVYQEKNDGVCAGEYTTKSYTVQSPLPAGSVVIATNGGSEYIYVPDHDVATVNKVISFLQSREEVGPIFVSARYSDLEDLPPKGTLSLRDVKLESTGRTPDIVYSFSWTWDDNETVNGLKGTEFESAPGAINRGMHGSFGPGDVHNTLLAAGPSFKASFADPLPSANVDVAPTVATILSRIFSKTVTVSGADGRPLYEALNTGVSPDAYQVAAADVTSSTTSGIPFYLPTNSATPGDVDSTATKGQYSVDLHIKTLSYAGKRWRYFDWAKAVRQ
jgi:arylsulfatase A-like enzyme